MGVEDAERRDGPAQLAHCARLLHLHLYACAHAYINPASIPLLRNTQACRTALCLEASPTCARWSSSSFHCPGRASGWKLRVWGGGGAGNSSAQLSSMTDVCLQCQLPSHPVSSTHPAAPQQTEGKQAIWGTHSRSPVTSSNTMQPSDQMSAASS